jgi:hypothetical protein
MDDIARMKRCSSFSQLFITISFDTVTYSKTESKSYLNNEQAAIPTPLPLYFTTLPPVPFRIIGQQQQ